MTKLIQIFNGHTNIYIYMACVVSNIIFEMMKLRYDALRGD